MAEKLSNLGNSFFASYSVCSSSCAQGLFFFFSCKIGLQFQKSKDQGMSDNKLYTGYKKNIWTSKQATIVLEKYGCGWIKLKFFYAIKKTWQWELSFVFLPCTQIATSYWDSLPCNNIHLEVELGMNLQSYWVYFLILHA